MLECMVSGRSSVEAHWCFGYVWDGSSMDVCGSTHAMPMANFEASHAETIADFDVSSSTSFSKGNVTAFGETLEGHETDAAVFVCEIGPYDVVEDVCFDSVDSER
jgi:hypothetical protein